LVSQNRLRTKTLLVEEANAVAWVGLVGEPIEGTDALALLTPLPLADPPSHVRDRAVTQALEQLVVQLPNLDSYAERRARSLLDDHRRVRQAAEARGSYSVRALTPPDVIGLFVLLPAVN
jgi:hypothetical protein